MSAPIELNGKMFIQDSPTTIQIVESEPEATQTTGNEEQAALVPVKEKKKEKAVDTVQPWWSCQGDDDEEDEIVDPKKLEKKFERMGWRQGGFLIGAYAATFLASIFFMKAPTNGTSTTPTISSEFAAASIDMAKKAIQFVPVEYQGRVRAATYLGLPAIFAASNMIETPNPMVNQALKAIPWIYPTFGVLRTDFSQYINLSPFMKFLSTDGKVDHKKMIAVVDAGLKIATSAAVLSATNNGFITAPAAVIFKGESRRWVDAAEQKILALEGPQRKAALAFFFGTLGAMAVAGGTNMYFHGPSALNTILLTPVIDTIIRTGKAKLKGLQNAKKDEKTEVAARDIKYFMKEAAKIGGMGAVVMVLGTLAAQAAKGSASFATTTLIDIISIVKVLSKEISPYAMISIATLFMTIAGSVYMAKEAAGAQIPHEVYLILFGIAAVAYSTAMYQIRKQVVPPKKAEFLAAKAAKKAAKKAKKAAKAEKKKAKTEEQQPLTVTDLTNLELQEQL